MEDINCESFFDHIDDLLEFSNDEVENGLADNEPIEYNNFDSLTLEDSLIFSTDSTNSASHLSTELSVPYEDIAQLEWLSFVEDSFFVDDLTFGKAQSMSSTDSSRNQYQTSSPISVLESSGACTKGKTSPISREKRARTKRPRPTTFTLRASMQLISPTSNDSSHTDNDFVESRPKKKKIKILPPQNQNENPNTDFPSQVVRKCMHCEITKTPQWRAGPMGPKTLCNACGVRYKSGRLFPEYRPAASPTFIPSVHSNSHKKVLEMRSKNTEEKSEIKMVTKPQLCPAYM